MKNAENWTLAPEFRIKLDAYNKRSSPKRN